MVQFKLQHRGLVRKVTFKNVDQPSWHELSWKIGDVCNIPHAAVALTYLDPDGDKITISSQAELKEYYSSLDEDDLDSNAPHKFIVRNLNDGIPDPDAVDPREDMFLMRDAQTMAASTVGGGSQWGFNPEDEAERDPTKLRLSGYSTFADALSPLAGSATEPEEDRDSDPPVVGGFGAKPPSPAPAKSSGGGWSLPVFGAWGKTTSTTNNNNNNPPPASSPAADAVPKSSNPWAIPPAPANNEASTTKPPAWLGTGATSPTSGLAWGAPASIATGARPGLKSQGVSPSSIPAPGTTPSRRTPSQGPPARPSTLVPPPVAPTVQMDTMVADRASSYAASPAVTATIPKSGKKGKKRMTHREREAERAREEDARRAEEDRLAREEDERYEEEEARYEEQERRAMEAEAKRERDENARLAAEAAAYAATQEQRRNEERRSEERERQKAEEGQRRASFLRHQSQMSQESDWQHVQDQTPEQEDEEAYRARIQASIANVFGTSPPAPQQQQQQQQQPQQPRQRKSSTRSKGKESNGKSKVYPPTPAPKKFFDSDLASESGRGGQNGLNVPTTPGYGQHTSGHSAPPTPGYGPSAAPSHGTDGNTAQVCNDVADLLGSFGRILDSEPDLLDAIREAFSHGPASGALNAAFGKRNLSPEMARIVSSVDDLLTKILPHRPAGSPYASNNMELEPRVPTPSVTPTPVNPAEPEFGVPPTEYSGGFEFANRGRQPGVPVITVPRPKYPASSITREGYSTGTTPPGPAQSGYGYATSPYPSGSPDRSAARSRSRPPPGEFEIVPPSRVPPQARMVVPPPVVPGDETEDSPMTPDVSRGFTRQSVHESGLVLAGQPGGTAAKADMETARQHYKSQRELYKLEKAERKKEMEERAAAKAERKRAKAAASADPKIADLANQLQDIGIPQRPYEAERRYIENPYENPRTAGAYPGSSRASMVYAEGLGQVTLVPTFAASSAVTAPVSPVHEEAPQSFDRVRRRRQSLNNASPERYSHSHAPPSVGRTESYHGLQPDAYPGAAHHAPPYIPAPPPQQDLAKRVALKLTEMGYTPQKYPSLPAIVGHRIRPVMNTHGVNESELAYHIVQDLFKYTGQT